MVQIKVDDIDGGVPHADKKTVVLEDNEGQDLRDSEHERADRIGETKRKTDLRPEDDVDTEPDAKGSYQAADQPRQRGQATTMQQERRGAGDDHADGIALQAEQAQKNVDQGQDEDAHKVNEALAGAGAHQ